MIIDIEFDGKIVALLSLHNNSVTWQPIFPSSSVEAFEHAKSVVIAL